MKGFKNEDVLRILEVYVKMPLQRQVVFYWTCLSFSSLMDFAFLCLTWMHWSKFGTIHLFLSRTWNFPRTSRRKAWHWPSGRNVSSRWSSAFTEPSVLHFMSAQWKTTWGVSAREPLSVCTNGLGWRSGYLQLCLPQVMSPITWGPGGLAVSWPYVLTEARVRKNCWLLGA